MFDYLDKDDGGVIQIVHTGKSSDDVNVEGAIKGAKELVFKFCPSEGYLPAIIPIPAPSETKSAVRFFSLISLIYMISGVIIVLFSSKYKFAGLILVLLGIISLLIFFINEKSTFAKYRDIIENAKKNADDVSQ